MQHEGGLHAQEQGAAVGGGTLHGSGECQGLQDRWGHGRGGWPAEAVKNVPWGGKKAAECRGAPQGLGKALWVAQPVEGALGRHVWGGVLTVLLQCNQGMAPSVSTGTHRGPALEPAVCRASGVGPGWGATPPAQHGRLLISWQAPWPLFKVLQGTWVMTLRSSEPRSGVSLPGTGG